MLTLLETTVGNIETANMRDFDSNVSRHLRFILLFFVIIPLCSCAEHYIKTTQPKGVYHRVKSGDTLWNIARAYRVNIQELAEANNITDPNVIEVGSAVFIPDVNYIVEDVMASKYITGAKEYLPQKEIKPGDKEAKTEKLPPASEKSAVKEPPKHQRKSPVKTTVKEGTTDIPAQPKAESQNASGAGISDTTGKMTSKQEVDHKAERVKQRDNGGESETIKFDRDRFIWPVQGKICSKFGIQPNGMYYNGIRISAKEGTPVLAAASGTAIFSGFLKDYGETIIIKHEENYATVYTHLNNRIIKADDRVKRGSRIATLEKGGQKNDPYINFEIRYKNKARNPIFFLP